MKIFSNKMPDLNWKNEKVQDAMIEVAKTWLNWGVDGFRLDAVSHLDRAPFEDAKALPNEKYPLDWFKFSNLPKVHDYLKKLNQEVFSVHDCVAIGEVGGSASIESGLNYSAFDSNELSMVFSFDHNWCNNLSDIINPKKLKTNVKDLKTVFNAWQTAFKDRGWLPLNWLSHDQPRLISHYGDYKYPLQSGKMLATVLHMMRGTPFIYQGEEIGMTNYPFDDAAQFNDVSSIAAYQYYLEQEPDDPVKALKRAGLRSRDNARTAMQWSNKLFAGFSYQKPIPLLNPNYKKVNVQKQLKNQNSLWYHYQKLIQLRRFSIQHDVITLGDFELIETNDELYVYKRTFQDQTLLIINSFSRKKQSFDVSPYEIVETLITNYPKTNIKDQKILLKPYESIVFKVKEIL
ncbi:MAG TPA: hypothetical protein DHV05_00825 [Acholeplasmataceae bacterium]|nr:hypothetical protein [Acholeplasmataceae bacterium]